jgi:hypothetical protein
MRFLLVSPESHRVASLERLAKDASRLANDLIGLYERFPRMSDREMVVLRVRRLTILQRVRKLRGTQLPDWASGAIRSDHDGQDGRKPSSGCGRHSCRSSSAALPPEQRQQYESQFEERFEQLLTKAANGADGEAFVDLLGFGGKGSVDFDNVSYPYLKPDFDDSIVPSQLHAAADLYYIYQHERMKVFQVVDTLVRLFRMGKIRLTKGPGARGLYMLEKWKPLRYGLRDRMIAYRRAFNYGNVEAPAGAVVNRNFHRQFVGFMSAVAQ